MRRAIGQTAQDVIQPILIGLGEIMQHIVGHGILVAGMADAKAHTGIGL